MYIDFPFHTDARGRTAGTTDDDHLRDLIEQVLFTTPGERVNRPAFGSGVLQLVFAPNSDELATATEFLVRSALQQWLSDLVEVHAVDVTAEDSTLSVAVRYRPQRSTQVRTAVFTRQV
jgi:phage baseplate assembly protein W